MSSQSQLLAAKIVVHTGHNGSDFLRDVSKHLLPICGQPHCFATYVRGILMLTYARAYSDSDFQKGLVFEK